MTTANIKQDSHIGTSRKRSFTCSTWFTVQSLQWLLFPDDTSVSVIIAALSKNLSIVFKC
ncbi:hypothetical protein Hanom_Chr17g01537181 [Helianthus anomalus]